MRIFFQFVSIGLCLLVLSACGTQHSYPAVIQLPAGEEAGSYSYSLQFRKKRLEGILVVHRMTPAEIRFLFTTYFGMSVFDYSFRRDSFRVNSCMAPMKRKSVEALMANDFRLLFVGNGTDTATVPFLPVEKRKQGRGFLKSRLTIHRTVAGNPDSITIHHPLLGLTMRINHLADSTPEMDLEESPDSLTEPDI